MLSLYLSNLLIFFCIVAILNVNIYDLLSQFHAGQWLGGWSTIALNILTTKYFFLESESYKRIEGN